ncbi:MAG: S-layer homology domain-containing protein [Peptoanaerobacter stomatis]|uniref:S-layer homology domain-containing protein n=1 Tax=Peptoanaerobacter stomatis TaxID=796937 RepID=UPI003F9EE80A
MLKAKRISMLTIFMLIMSIISTQVYAEKIPFTDVSEKSWYYDDVKSAYESNLINGKKADKYAPDDNMTAAEAVKLAAAMHKLKNEGKVDFVSSKPWYKVYVEYAKQKNLITDDLDWNKKITRAGYMQIFAQILTDEESKKNSVADGSIPDVPMTHPSAQAIYKLYRAGVVVGVDDKRNCSPGSNIKRSEVAAILIRMMDVKRRLSFSIEAPAPGTTPPGTTPPGATPTPEEKPLRITKQPENVIGDFIGDVVTLEVKVEGGKEPYNYQWQYRKVGDRDYTNIRIVDEATNVLKYTVDRDTYDCRCVITDAKGDKVTSNEARVELKAGPLRITKEPAELIEGKEGDFVTLEVEVAGGKQPYTYKWYRKIAVANIQAIEEVPYEGSKTRSVKVPFVPETRYQYLYRCEIIDADGNRVVTKFALVKVDPSTAPPIIIKQPENKLGIPSGHTVSLEVKVSGGKEPYRYQWEERKEGNINYTNSMVEGNTRNVLRPKVEMFTYYYRCVITDANGNKVTSDEAKVEIDPNTVPIKVTKQLVDVRGVPGDVVTLEVAAEGGVTPLRYQWQERKVGDAEYKNLPFATATTHRVPVTGEPYDYRCVIHDAKNRWVISNKSRVVWKVRIDKEPEDASGRLGDRVTLEVKAEGGIKPYRYQWVYVKDGDTVFRNSTSEGNTTNVLKPPVENDIYWYVCNIMDDEGVQVMSRKVQVRKR